VHPNLVHLLDYFEDKDFYFLVMEMMTGGELFTRIVEKVGLSPSIVRVLDRFLNFSRGPCRVQEKYSEAEARRVIRTLTEAIDYCHNQYVVHRDLKVFLHLPLVTSGRVPSNLSVSHVGILCSGW
jgi:calcium/calmodulin-dependent protein kinase I